MQPNNKKKRQSLADFQTGTVETLEKPIAEQPPEPERRPGRPSVSQRNHVSAYLPIEARKQLDLLAIHERKPSGARKAINDFILEGLNLLFAQRGLPSIEEMEKQEKL